jgi:uncharacterized linocin/CFP29 family protein
LRKAAEVEVEADEDEITANGVRLSRVLEGLHTFFVKKIETSTRNLPAFDTSSLTAFAKSVAFDCRMQQQD